MQVCAQLRLLVNSSPSLQQQQQQQVTIWYWKKSLNWKWGGDGNPIPIHLHSIDWEFRHISADSWINNTKIGLTTTLFLLAFILCLPRQGRNIVVFRSILEYSSLRDFYRPLLGNNNRSIFYFLILFSFFSSLLPFSFDWTFLNYYFRKMALWKGKKKKNWNQRTASSSYFKSLIKNQQFSWKN